MPTVGHFSLWSLRNYFLMKKSQLRVKQIYPNTVICDWCSYNYISTLLAMETSVAQWLELLN